MIAVDVADRDAVHEALARAAAERGDIEVLVCSAGITRPGRFLELDDEVFRSMVEVDYFGTLWPVRAVAPGMVERGHGSIVGVSSAAGLVGVYGYSAYGAAKFAVRGLLESLRTELAPLGVHVGCAFPADVDTPMLAEEEQWKPAETKAIAGAIRPLSAEQVAAAVVAGIDHRRAEIYADLPDPGPGPHRRRRPGAVPPPLRPPRATDPLIELGSLARPGVSPAPVGPDPAR